MRKAVTRMFGVCADAIVVLALQGSEKTGNGFDGNDGSGHSRKVIRPARKGTGFSPLAALRISLGGSR